MEATNPHRPSQRIVRKRNMQKVMPYARQQDPQRNDSSNQNARVGQRGNSDRSGIPCCTLVFLASCPRTGVMLELMAETV